MQMRTTTCLFFASVALTCFPFTSSLRGNHKHSIEEAMEEVDQEDQYDASDSPKKSSRRKHRHAAARVTTEEPPSGKKPRVPRTGRQRKSKESATTDEDASADEGVVMDCGEWGNQKVRLLQIESQGDNFKRLREFMKVQKPEQLNKGGDTKPYPKYKDLDLVAAWEVHNEEVSKNYKLAKRSLEKTGGANSTAVEVPLTKGIRGVKKDYPLARRFNEKYFYHGTQPAYITPIACAGLKEGGGLFGAGTYLADVPDKSDQYATHDGEGDVRALAQYATESAYNETQGDLHYMIIVRGLLGRTFEGDCGCSNCDCTDTLKCNRCGRVKSSTSGKMLDSRERPKIVQPKPHTDHDMNMTFFYPAGEEERFHSLCVQHKKGSCIQRFNECLVPKGSNRVKVEFVLAYRRCKESLSKGACVAAKS